MTRKTGWEEPSKGPDWMDVESLMRAIGGLHSGHVAVVLSPLGIGFSGGVDVAASILFETLPGSSLPANVVVNARWPSHTHSTLAACAFWVLHQLDHEISKVYKNESLWK